MQITGWIVRTGGWDDARYWKVGEPSPERAGAMAAAAGSKPAQAICKIAGSYPSAGFSVIDGAVIELWQQNAAPASGGELTFDTVIDAKGEDHIEGCYRIGSGAWKVYYLTHWQRGRLWTGDTLIRGDVTFQSGIGGIDGVLPVRAVLNKATCIQVLSEVTGVISWMEILGPDSLILK